MAWVEILPSYESLFRGWKSASSFLSWTGILVNQHRHRQVERVDLETQKKFYLKKESAVTWRDRIRNAWDGFGWCATAVREAAMLQALRQAGIGCPEVVALGEDERRAFVLTRAETAMMDLRVLLPMLDVEDRHRLASALGQELARMHNAGFDHPDLFAKHILAAIANGAVRICILDWQRGRRRRRVPWSVRCRDLAVLDATLHASLASDRWRLRCLGSYCRSLAESPPVNWLARRIRAQAGRFRRNRNLREVGQLAVPPGDQEFVALDEGQTLVVRAYYENAGGDGVKYLVPVADSRIFMQRGAASGPAWKMPELAHTLFRLQRFGVPAPRLRAVGCVNNQVVIHTESAEATPLPEAIAKAPAALRSRWLREAGAIVRTIHDAGYCLPVGDSWGHRIGIASATGAVTLVTVELLQRTSKTWEELGPRELAQESTPWSGAEHQWFLQGYLGAKEVPRGYSERQAAS